MEPARRQPTRMSTSTSSSGHSSHNPVHSPRDIREKVHRFRVLIIGRANAGKTTILKKLCYETENPAICDATGHPVNLAALDPSDERGLHDINYAMIFRSNPGFVFHDSRGFEAGANDELKKVRGFLDRRNHTTNLQDRVHAIWYCIPLDDARPVQKPEIEFFEKCGTGDIPVIAVFTKLDSLDDKAFGRILDENDDVDQNTALSMVPEYSQRLFDELVPKLRISRAMYPPRSHVGLRDMHLPESTCLALLEHTGMALDDETLHLMFVSVQRSILSMCTRLAFEKLLTETRNFDKNKHLTVKEAQKAILWYYPHLIEDLIEVTQMDESIGLEMEARERKLQRLRRLIMDHTSEGWTDLKPWRDLRIQSLQETESIQARLGTLAHGVFRLSGAQLAEFAIALGIIADHSYFIKQRDRSLDFKDSIEIGIQDFMGSPQLSNSSRAIHTILDKLQSQRQTSTGLFKIGQKSKDEAAKTTRDLILEMGQIVLDHRINIEDGEPAT